MLLTRCFGYDCSSVVCSQVVEICQDYYFNFFISTGALDEAGNLRPGNQVGRRSSAISCPVQLTVCIRWTNKTALNFHPNVFRIFCIIYFSISVLTKTKKVGEKACLTLTLPHSITLTDEFLIYSMKGTADIKEQLLAYMFKLCIATVRRNTITWASYLFIVFILTSYLEKQGKSQVRHVPEILDVLCQCQVHIITLETASFLTLQ